MAIAERHRGCQRRVDGASGGGIGRRSRVNSYEQTEIHALLTTLCSHNQRQTASQVVSALKK